MHQSSETATVAFMNEIFSYMSSCDTTHALLDSIHHSLQSVIYAENFFVVLLNYNERYVTFPFYRDVIDTMSEEELNKVPLDDIFSTLTFYAIKKKKIVCLKKPEIDELLSRDEVTMIGTIPKQWLCFPLQHKGLYLGSFVVQSYRKTNEYDDKDIEILSFISNVIAAAIFLFNKNIELTSALSELEEYKEQLEVKIKDRTSELEQTLASLQQEIAKSKELQEQLAYEAFHDNLTGLYNRKFFSDQIVLAASRAARESGTIYLAYMDLDGFKQINDTFGHNCGDFVLKTTAERLLSCFRRHDILARFGGDEFVLLITSAITEANLAKIFQRVINTVSKPITINETEVSVGISIGIAGSTEAECIRQHLLSNADNALYQAKQAGKGRYILFTD